MGTRRSLAGLAALALLGCSSSDDGGGDKKQGPPVEPPCTFEATSWRAGQQAFRDATADFGIEALSVEAVRVSVVDLDGDLWPDLLVRAGGAADDFAQGERHRWLLRNTGGTGFEDVTESSGLLTPRLSSTVPNREGEVVASADVDNDGDLDVLMAKDVTDATDPTLETTELLLNDGAGRFELGPAQSDVRQEGRPSAPRGLAFVDFDLDGNIDVLISENMLAGATTPLQDRLMRGMGDGSFVDATHDVGLTTESWISPVTVLNEALGHARGWGATSCDLNNDGRPELLSASYGRAPNHLWQASLEAGATRYTNRSLASGYAFDHRADWTDNLSAQCHCFDNPADDQCDLPPPPPSAGFCQNLWNAFGGTYRWSHPSDREAWRLGGVSATTTCADIDNDGFADLMTGEIVHSDVGESSDPAEILFNRGEAGVGFIRPGNEVTGLTRERQGSVWNDGDMNNAVFDFDNDGLLDVYVSSSDYPGTRGLLFHQVAPRSFEAVPLADGVDHLRSAGAIAVDLDRDGDLDLVVGHSRFRCDPAPTDCYDTQKLRIFENLAADQNHWVELRLEGAVGTNRAAIGARVTVEACGVTQTRFVDGGHGHMGAQEDRVLHFGLGHQTTAEVTVHWPDASGTEQSFTVDADALYSVKQGADPEPIEP